MKIAESIEHGQIGYLSDADAARRLGVTRERVGQIRREAGILRSVTQDGDSCRVVARVGPVWIAVPDVWEVEPRVCDTLDAALRVVGARPIPAPYPPTLGLRRDGEIAQAIGRSEKSVAEIRKRRNIASPRRLEYAVTGAHRETTCYVEHIDQWACVLWCDGEAPLVGFGTTRAEAQEAADCGR